MKYVLKFSAHLENISELELDVGANNHNVGLYLKMQCVTCNKLQTKMIVAVPDFKWSDMKEAPTNMMKCEDCERVGAVMISGGKAPLSQELSESGCFVSLMEISSTMFEPADCIFSRGWKVETTAGKEFYDIDLSSGEFFDYDEVGGCPVSATELRTFFEVLDDGGGSSSATKRRWLK